MCVCVCVCTHYQGGCVRARFVLFCDTFAQTHTRTRTHAHSHALTRTHTCACGYAGCAEALAADGIPCCCPAGDSGTASAARCALALAPVVQAAPAVVGRACTGRGAEAGVGGRVMTGTYEFNSPSWHPPACLCPTTCLLATENYLLIIVFFFCSALLCSLPLSQ